MRRRTHRCRGCVVPLGGCGSPSSSCGRCLARGVRTLRRSRSCRRQGLSRGCASPRAAAAVARSGSTSREIDLEGQRGDRHRLPDKRTAHSRRPEPPARRRQRDGDAPPARGRRRLMDVETGNVLVYASHIEKGPKRDLAVEATAPAASVFKIITGTSLVETCGPDARQKECYSGGEQRTHRAGPRPRSEARQVVHDPRRRDGTQHQHRLRAPGRSRTSSRRSSRRRRSRSASASAAALRRRRPAERAAASPRISSASRVRPPGSGTRRSRRSTPPGLERDDRARRRAGAARARDGHRRRRQGRRGARRPRLTQKRVMKPDDRASRHDDDGDDRQRRHVLPRVPRHEGHARFLPGVSVAGKTGTLTDATSQRFYTWFTGFAPSKPSSFAEARKTATSRPSRARSRSASSSSTIRSGRSRRTSSRARCCAPTSPAQNVPGVTPPRDDRSEQRRSASARRGPLGDVDDARDEAAPAARLVVCGAADEELALHADESLRAARRGAASRADGLELGHVLGDAHERGHRAERLAAVVLIEARRR